MKLPEQSDWVAVDTETTGLYVDEPCKRQNCGCGGGAHIIEVSLAGDGWSVAIPFDMRDTLNEWGEGPVTNSSLDDWERLLTWLKNQKLIFQHAKFDLDMFRRGAPNGWHGAELVDMTQWDTKLGSWLRWPLETTSLKPTAERLWGKDERTEQADMEKWLEDHKHKKYEMWYAPPRYLLPYARQDAELTYRLYDEQQKTNGGAQDYDITGLDDRELAVMRTLSRMEARGVGFDSQKAVRIQNYLLEQQTKISEALPFGETRAKAIKWWRENGFEKTLDSLPKTEKGDVSLDDKSRAVILSGVGGGGLPKLPHSVNFFRYLDIDLALSRYFGEGGWRSLVGKDGRIRPDYKQDGTSSMRFSCSRVNLQAIPQDWKTNGRYPNPRNCFVARPGYKLVELDLSQAEMRVATAVSGCKKMRQIIESGKKIHDSTTEEIFKVHPSDKDWDKFYHIAKILNFAILYGAGPLAVVELLSDKIEVTEVQARDFINKHQMLFPEFRNTMREAQTKAEKQSYVTLVSGRRRYFGKEENKYKAFNAVIQGNVAESMKDWMLWIDSIYPNRLLLQIHDSVVLELPEDSADEIAADIKRAGEEQMTETFGIPMRVDMKSFVEVKEKETAVA